MIQSRNRRPIIRLRKAWREGERIRKKTIVNLTSLPPAEVEGICRMVKGGIVLDTPDETFCVRRCLVHGHVCAVMGLCRPLNLPRILQCLRSRERDLALATIVARVLSPDSKVATGPGNSRRRRRPSASVEPWAQAQWRVKKCWTGC